MLGKDIRQKAVGDDEVDLGAVRGKARAAAGLLKHIQRENVTDPGQFRVMCVGYHMLVESIMIVRCIPLAQSRMSATESADGIAFV